MEIILNETEIRIVGCLIEKEMTTPEYYPLSLNALTNACNQKSNRDPVVSYDETTVANGLESLREKGLARESQSASTRVSKYVHTILDLFDLSRQEIAILCELMLRGPQTLGELRSRAGRMSTLENLGEVQNTMQGLIGHDPPLAVKLPREAGRKERRYAHLLSGDIDMVTATHDSSVKPAAPRSQVNERIIKLEEEVAKLRREFEELKRAFNEFRSQF
jgi:hypothetical protein